MLWSPEASYYLEPFEKEADLESAIQEVSPALFGPDRIYLEVKRRIGTRGRTQNVPDAYLIDLSSSKRPLLWVVENELAKHDPLRHIAVQILQMSLSFEATPQRVKAIVKGALEKDADDWRRAEEYALANGFENIDYLLSTSPAVVSHEVSCTAIPAPRLSRPPLCSACPAARVRTRRALSRRPRVRPSR